MKSGRRLKGASFMRKIDILSFSSFQKISAVLLILGPAATSYSLVYFLRHGESLVSCLIVFLLGIIYTFFGVKIFFKLKKFVFLRVNEAMKKITNIMFWIFLIVGLLIGVWVNFLN